MSNSIQSTRTYHFCHQEVASVVVSLIVEEALVESQNSSLDLIYATKPAADSRKWEQVNNIDHGQRVPSKEHDRILMASSAAWRMAKLLDYIPKTRYHHDTRDRYNFGDSREHFEKLQRAEVDKVGEGRKIGH
jgi:hypothetical protein